MSKETPKKKKPGIDILDARLVETPPPLSPLINSVIGYQLLIIQSFVKIYFIYITGR
jgi:hypothetical protein